MRHSALYRLSAWLWLLLGMIAWAAAAQATEVLLKDGRILHGKLGKVASLADIPQATQPDGGGPLQLILLLDDELRRTFVSDRLMREVRQEANRQLEEKFTIRQRALRNGSSIKSVGPPARIQPFDEFGRRIFTMVTAKGPVDIIQGITELTPQWTKVEGISHVWDMRIATSSIPRDTLQKILLKQINPKEMEHYKKVARFYLQCERYEEARAALEALLAAFPDQADLKEQLAPSIRAIGQLSAQRLTAELKLRRDAGQHQLVSQKLKKFPTEGVPGEILQGIREMAQEYDTREARLTALVKHLKGLAGRIKDTVSRENLKPILEEIAGELTLSTLDRMAAFLQNADDADTKDDEKVALAISGWLLGANAARTNLDNATSAYKVRRLVREYVNEPVTLNRERIFSYIKQEYAGDPATVAALLANMKPAVNPPEPVADKPGYYELETTGLPKEPAVTYYVQLPPEYDPYRRYPTVVTLNGAGTSAEQQIDWWAGAWAGDARTGQATRYGYIVVAPVWSVEHQKQYGYSAREHAAVLNCLRDACRRFAIDTDRVYLSGHSMGGDAAWDIGLAHPDLWAGAIPIVAQSDRYCALYWENARYVPFYVVAGELDGAKLTKNARDLDRYLKRGFDTTVVEFLGRGHEDFYDEILRIFDWMGRFRRNFFPREFTCETMRPWDNFFWWVELQGLPPRAMVDPANWPPPAGTQPVQVKGTINNKNGLNVRTGTSQVTVWLSPDMIDFNQRATITVNGRRLNAADQIVRPELRTLLEDVRTRGDRQHPFWAKLEGATGRLHGE
jgi:pimeloyl-ACP methyl ester carboxylesterase/thioredoxin-like negative regulator of GroEL